jgi:hypothetical protein
MRMLPRDIFRERQGQTGPPVASCAMILQLIPFHLSRETVILPHGSHCIAQVDLTEATGTQYVAMNQTN